jgi:NAD(P)-dependent dehydrogenase (short-subunit alcohol dehydrogenase family)
MDQSLKGKVAIISGSDSGIGAQIARDLSAVGATVIINYPAPALIERASAVVASLSTPGLAVEADISSTTGPQKLIDETVKAYGKIDILVNNAGIAVNLPFEEQTLEHWDSVVNLNCRGTFLLTQAALRHLAPQDARIINICSISARDGPPRQTIYSGSKGMIDSFTRVWAKELPPKYNCTVNSVSPGPTRTEGFQAAGEEMMKVLSPLIEKTPVGNRMAETGEIAYAVLMLSLPRASWLNGVHLVASGGLFID